MEFTEEEDQFLIALKKFGGSSVSLIKMWKEGKVFFHHPLKEGADLIGRLIQKQAVNAVPEYDDGGNICDYKVTFTPAGRQRASEALS